MVILHASVLIKCGMILWGQKCGRVDEQIELLRQKLRMIYQGEAFNGKPTKTARSHGKKFQVSIKQETSRILVSWIPSFLITPSISFFKIETVRYLAICIFPSYPITSFLMLSCHIIVTCTTRNFASRVWILGFNWSSLVQLFFPVFSTNKNILLMKIAGELRLGLHAKSKLHGGRSGL